MLIRPNRRDILRLAAMAPAFALPAIALPRMARAELGAPATDNPAHFRFSLGAARLTVLSDGFFTLPTTGLGVNADPKDVQAMLAAHYLPTDLGYSHTNHLLVELGDAKVLVDVGSGTRWLPTVGRLLANMAAAGMAADDITHVVITHAHPDHIWGIRDEFDEVIFPQAEYVIGAAEQAYWTQDGLVDRVPPEAQQFVLGAVNSIAAQKDWTQAEDGHEVAPGIRLIATPGHTPGHMSVVVEDGGKQLIALGDSMSHAVLNFARPAWFNGFDADGAQTVATRGRLLDMAAADGMAVLGYHFPFPGVGHVMKTAAAYEFLPALWQFSG
jgi:glyoxylase-like metal-dependent hydrolase (beta-lactamase superfamily II)